jgi:anti-sigma factor RsiW
MHPTELAINDYVEGALTRAEQADVERHLAGCSECRHLVDNLRDLRRRVATLPAVEPPDRAWTRIAQSIREEQRRRMRTRWTWLAAAAALVLSTIVGLRLAGLRERSSSTAGTAALPPNAETIELAQSVESELRQAEQHYQNAISGLQQIANAEKGALDPQTASTLEKNLAEIDRAMNDSRAALKAQPNSEPAQQSLLDSFKTKLALLEDTVALINEMRKGDDAGAARVVSGLKQKS